VERAAGFEPRSQRERVDDGEHLVQHVALDQLAGAMLPLVEELGAKARLGEHVVHARIGGRDVEQRIGRTRRQGDA
jgi:hypothetical protein